MPRKITTKTKQAQNNNDLSTYRKTSQTHTHGRVKQRVRNKVHGITQEQQLKPTKQGTKYTLAKTPNTNPQETTHP